MQIIIADFFMPEKNISIAQLRNLIKTGKLSDPILFLEALQAGQDPRKRSEVREYVVAMDNENGGKLSDEQWEELFYRVSIECAYAPVKLDQSFAAAKILSEYLHPKLKQVDINNGEGGKGSGLTPLSVDEILLFKDWFNSEF